HLARRDVGANAIASVALCIFWFNPLIYWAMNWLRTDQELACDALVLAQRGDARRCYANALLKTQLATESGWRMPVGCHWQSNHSLKERIVMLKRPLPGMSRQFTGVALIVVLTVAGGYTAWAAQAADGTGPRIHVDMKVKVTNTQSKEVFAVATRYVVRSGELPSDMKVPPVAFACTPYLSSEIEKSAAWVGMKARGLPLPPPGYILLDCTIRQDGEVVATPAVMALDGKPATIETTDRDKIRQYRIELNASTADAVARR
ncbi:MAG: M56 family metallopeptidase, partial [Peristeroidobacter soli]